MDQSMTTWAVNVVQLGVLGVLAFLVRNAFANVEKSIEGFGKKIDAISVDMARGDGDRRVLEARLHAAEQRLDRMEREITDLSEGVAR